MSRSLSDYVAQIQPLIRDRTNGTVEVSDVKDSLNRCIRSLIGEHGIYASQNWQTQKVFPTVHEYPLPSDFHDIIDVRSRSGGRNFLRVTSAEFWKRLNQQDDMLAIDAIQGTRFLLLRSSSSGSSAVLHSCDSLTDNGTWAADTSTSDAANLTLDTVDKMSGTGSLNFDATVSQSVNNYAVLTNSTMTAVDLSSQSDKGVLFMWVYLPVVTNFTSISARWGSDASNYYSNTATTQYNGQAWRVGWNRVGIGWSGATETGTVTDTAIDYLRLQFTYTASYANATDFRVDDIRMETPEQLEISYYSRNFCQSSGGTAQQVFTDTTSDETLLADEDDDILLWWALAECLEIKEAKPTEIEGARQKYERALMTLKMRHGSDRKRPTRKYY